jgi:DNA-binding NtrC family response regulator
MATIAMIHNGKRQAKPAPHTEARLQRAIERIAESDCPLLILGEHGTGKRSIAAQIHARSNLSRSALQEIRCMDATDMVLRSALSTEGTLYLIDIAELSLPLQELIVNTYFRSEEAQGCRLLFGSSRDLTEEVKSWRMREDFYYHISAVTLRIPPLRCRKAEILSIADMLMTQYSKQFARPLQRDYRTSYGAQLARQFVGTSDRYQDDSGHRRPGNIPGGHQGGGAMGEAE